MLKTMMMAMAAMITTTRSGMGLIFSSVGHHCQYILNFQQLKIDGDQSECVERVKAQQEARKSDPRGHEDRRSRGFGDTSPARELPWLTSPPPEQEGDWVGPPGANKWKAPAPCWP